MSTDITENGRVPAETTAAVVDASVTESPARTAPATDAPETANGAGTDAPRRPAGPTSLVVLVTVLVLLGAGAGWLGALLWPPTFAARAEVLYPITKEQPTGFLRDDRNLTTQLVLLDSQTVLGPVAAQLGIPVDTLRRDVGVDLVGGSEVIQVEARDRSPEVALRTVAAVLDRYLAVSAVSTPSGAQTYLQGQLDAVRGELARLGPTTTTPGPEQQALLAREQQILAQLDENAVVDVSAPQAQVLAPPYPVERAVSPRLDLAALAGALGGALVGAVAVGLVLRRRRS